MTNFENNVCEAHGITDLLIDVFMSGAVISDSGRSGLVTVLECLKARIPTDDDVLILDRLQREKATQ